MDKQARIESIDGRRERSARSRAAIITATLTLLDNGNLSPTAKQISVEAGVGLRSFFRHFEDMDALPCLARCDVAGRGLSGVELSWL